VIEPVVFLLGRRKTITYSMRSPIDENYDDDDDDEDYDPADLRSDTGANNQSFDPNFSSSTSQRLDPGINTMSGGSSGRTPGSGGASIEASSSLNIQGASNSSCGSSMEQP